MLHGALQQHEAPLQCSLFINAAAAAINWKVQREGVKQRHLFFLQKALKIMNNNILNRVQLQISNSIEYFELI